MKCSPKLHQSMTRAEVKHHIFGGWMLEWIHETSGLSLHFTNFSHFLNCKLKSRNFYTYFFILVYIWYYFLYLFLLLLIFFFYALKRGFDGGGNWHQQPVVSRWGFGAGIWALRELVVQQGWADGYWTSIANCVACAVQSLTY